MALSISSSPLILIHQNPNPTTPPSKRVLMLANRNSQEASLPLAHIRSSTKLQKVFEDRSSGVICYRDDKGEITCEGYDEGPRIHHQGFSIFSCNQRPRQSQSQRDAEAIVDFLNRSLLQVVNGGGEVN